MAVTYDKIATATGNGSSATFQFTSIPSTYTDLVVIVTSKASTNNEDLYLRFNGDTGTNYSSTWMWGNGTSTGSSRQTNNSSGILCDSYGQPQMNNNHILIINIFNYANTTTYKTALNRSNNATIGLDAIVGLWRSTAAINRIDVTYTAGTVHQTGSVASLYGIKAA